MQTKVSPFLALKSTNFRNYLFGASISEIGNQMQTVAVAWQIYEMTRNPASLGLIGLANIVPILLFSLIGGVTADKLNRKKLLIVSQICLAFLGFSLFIITTLGIAVPWMIYLILGLVATANSFSMPARQSILPHLIDRKFFMNAVSLNTLQFQFATMTGPAIAGFLIAGYGVSIVYLFNTLSFLAFIISVSFIKIPKHIKKEVEFSVGSVMEGVKFVVKTPILYLTMILDFLATFLGTATILMPVFAQDVLHVGPQGLGLLYSAPAIGGVIAGLLLSSIHNIKNQGRVIVVSVLIYGLAIIGFGFSKLLPLSIFFLVIMGLSDMISTIIRNTIRQMVTPDHIRGRMVSIMRIFFQGGPQLGEIEAGFLAAAIGGPATVIVGGVGVLVITSIVAWKNKALRNYQGKELEI